MSDTFTVSIAGGTQFDFGAPTAEMIDPAGILHHLVMISRWGGNVQFPFSVLQHSLLVAEAMPNPLERIYGFIHDWPEAILGADVVSPLKLYFHSLGLDVNAIERRIMNLVYRRLEISTPSREVAERVHEADMRARATEVRDVVANRAGIQVPAPALATAIRFKSWDTVLESGHQQLDSYLYLAREAA